MIPTKPRRIKGLRLPKVLERQYKQTNCQDCSVVVTRMDFAKILGKFTKVKIQFESNAPKHKRAIETSLTSRLKSNENGMVQVHRSAYNQHPAKKMLGIGKKTKSNQNVSPRQTTNVLKENNRIKKIITPTKDLLFKTDYDHSKLKHYGVVFVNPTSKKKEIKSKATLDNILANIDKNILPSEDWCIDYFPKKGEPKDDKIYDRIAAELEDLMYNEKTKNNGDNKDGKNDEFPSILDILNDTSKGSTDKRNDQSSSGSLRSSDVEAMLLGKSKSPEVISMDIDNPISGMLTEKSSSGNEITSRCTDKTVVASGIDDNPSSPSILDEPEPSEVPVLSLADKPLVRTPPNNSTPDGTPQLTHIDENYNTSAKNKNRQKAGVTQVIFKKTINGTSLKTLICPKNLKYTISIQGKAIELLGAPNVITSLEDLQVLLQIVEESELSSSYVLY